MKAISTLALLLFSTIIFAQYSYEASPEFPFGQAHPDAPQQIKDFQPMIGSCNCTSVNRNPDQSWAKPVDMIWNWKFIMNGKGVQDETLKADGGHSGSIRQFIADSSRWYVHYYSSRGPSTTLPVWEGNKKEGKIILYRDQKAPNGMEGFYRLTFYDMTDSGYKWIGEWVDKTEKIVYPTWKIECTKRNNETVTDLEIIKKHTEEFSQAYMDADYDALVDKYSDDAKIFPNNTGIISGKADIKKKWVLPESVKILLHKVTPSEIKIEGNYAYDYGIYEGKTLTKDKKEVPWTGKYVIVWKKIENDWKIYLDIWNNIKD